MIALFNRLKTVALVSNRVYASIAPQGVTLPYIVYRKMSINPAHTHNGYTVARSRFQISVFDTEYGKCQAVVTQVKTALDGVWTGAQASLLVNEVDQFENDTKIHHISLDYFIWHS